MAIEKVKAYFAQFGMEDRVLEFPQSSAIELNLEELARFSGSLGYVDVCKLA